MKLVQSLALSAVLGISFLNAASYNVDASHSDVAFKVKHMMISNVKGSFEKFSGTFSIDEKTKQFSAINGIVEAASLTTMEAKRDGHLKSVDFFDVAKYPQIHLKFLKQNDDKAEFELTIKDITKIVTLDVEEISGTVKDPWGYTRLAFELRGKINRKDFNINFNELLETGGLLVGDTVKFDIVIEGIQAK
ncbi:MAG: polyisoprenoid-binding protein YceI [Sulfurimonas sp.]|jgi:polyisoprenoid-binding protein YceI|uniref:YceI family protein n=1 Tax=Sulfurimonas sp. TaxID=2022749 RepID=UPI0039E3FDC6